MLTQEGKTVLGETVLRGTLKIGLKDGAAVVTAHVRTRDKGETLEVVLRGDKVAIAAALQEVKDGMLEE